jgi:hypothetical protein
VTHKFLLALSLLTTLLVAGLTVHLQVRARLRSYDLARGREDLLELRESCDAVRRRAASIWRPERVAALAERWREQRRDAPPGGRALARL